MKNQYNPTPVGIAFGRVQWSMCGGRYLITSWPDGETAILLRDSGETWSLGSHPIGEPRDPSVRIERATHMMRSVWLLTRWRRQRIENFLTSMGQK